MFCATYKLSCNKPSQFTDDSLMMRQSCFHSQLCSIDANELHAL